MENEVAAAEVKYRYARAVFSRLLDRGLISHEDWCALLRAAAEKYEPVIGRLEVESVALEIGYKG